MRRRRYVSEERHKDERGQGRGLEKKAKEEEEEEEGIGLGGPKTTHHHHHHHPEAFSLSIRFNKLAGELAAAICAEAFAQLNPTSQQQPDHCLSEHEEGNGFKK